MNKKAEAFQAYLDEKKISVFAREELEDEQKTTVFRSHITTEGQQLPTIVILDETVFAIVRVQIAARVLNDKNRQELLQLVNDESAGYKPFKLYFNGDGDLLLDTCLVIEDDQLNGDTVYTMFQVIINYLEGNYRRFMKTIWQGE